MARYSMYSGEQIETHVADDFDTRAGVVRPLQSEDLALLTSTSDILRPNISSNSSSRRHNGTEN